MSMLLTKQKPEDLPNSSLEQIKQVYKPVSKIIGFCLGSVMILLALLGLTTNWQVSDILAWLGQYFGISFSLLFVGLVLVAMTAIIRLKHSQQKQLCYEVAMQFGNGISTLALTYTLLGISLGIGALSQQSLSPENINNVISILTTQFSMAFMTTVVGLPTAALIRAWASILYVKQQASDKANFLEETL